MCGSLPACHPPLFTGPYGFVVVDRSTPLRLYFFSFSRAFKASAFCTAFSMSFMASAFSTASSSFAMVRISRSPSFWTCVITKTASHQTIHHRGARSVRRGYTLETVDSRPLRPAWRLRQRVYSRCFSSLARRQRRREWYWRNA